MTVEIFRLLPNGDKDEIADLMTVSKGEAVVFVFKKGTQVSCNGDENNCVIHNEGLKATVKFLKAGDYELKFRKRPHQKYVYVCVKTQIATKLNVSYAVQS